MDPFISAVMKALLVPGMSALMACALIPAVPQATNPPVTALAKELLIGDAVMMPMADDANFESLAAADAVRNQLAVLGYRVVVDAPYQVEATLAQRAISVAYQGGESNSETTARPRDGQIDLCHDHVFRLSVVVLDRQTAKVVYRGAAEKVRCGDLDKSDLREMARVAFDSLR